MNNRQERIERLHQQIDDLNEKIAELEARFDKAEAEAKVKYNSEIMELRNKKEEFDKKLEALKSQGEEASEGILKGTEDAWNKLKDAFSNAASKFK